MAGQHLPFEALRVANPTYAYVCAFIDELPRSGVRHIVICPGSRSTPLALAAASHPELRVWMHVDERSAAFFALGMAKRLAQPVALLCTSGTAAANFLPAIVEANLTHVPLLVLTADRPPELRDCGAPQAIDQNRLYGTHVKWFAEVALPEASNAALRYIRTITCRAAAQARALPAGPVHLNLPFREPLTPEELSGQPLPPEEQRDPVAWFGRPANAPYVRMDEARAAALDPLFVADLAQSLRERPRGLIVVGPLYEPTPLPQVLDLARTLGYPILADPLSQLRCGEHEQELIISSYDAFLRNTAFVERCEPQFVLRFGAMPVSKPLLLYLKRYAHCPQVVVAGQGGWEEPTQLASEIVYADPAAFCTALLSSFAGNTQQTSQGRTWASVWQDVERTTRAALRSAMLDFPQMFEGRIFSELAEILPAGAALYAGNSMPVRDMDTFFWNRRPALRIVGNRGASGIDGVVSSALGFSAASSREEPVVLVIGDLSFFHDLNGLLAARLHNLNLVVVLVDNNGGGIFSFLSQAAYPEHFEQLFGTPTHLDFRPVVQMYGGSFHRIENWEDFRAAVTQGLAAGGLHVVQVTTERASNVELHRRLWRAVDAALGERFAAWSEEEG